MIRGIGVRAINSRTAGVVLLSVVLGIPASCGGSSSSGGGAPPTGGTAGQAGGGTGGSANDAAGASGGRGNTSGTAGRAGTGTDASGAGDSNLASDVDSSTDSGRWAGCSSDAGVPRRVPIPMDSSLACNCTEASPCPLDCSPRDGCQKLDVISWRCSFNSFATLLPEQGLVAINWSGGSSPGFTENFYDVCSGELVGWIGVGGQPPKFCQGIVADFGPTLGWVCDTCLCDLASAIAMWRAGYIAPP